MAAENDRETGARKAQKREASDRDQSQGDAAENKPSNEAQGPSQPLDQNDPSDGARKSRRTPSRETQKFAGAGPAIAEHSKDAKAPKAGRQRGAYVKD